MTGEQPDTPAALHATDTDSAFLSFASSAEGLTQAEAARRVEQYGPNRLQPAKKKDPLARFFAQFHNVLIYVLLGAGIITALLGHWVDSGVIFGVVVINAIIGFIQEGKAEKALDAIRNMLSQQAMVRRDGRCSVCPRTSWFPVTSSCSSPATRYPPTCACSGPAICASTRPC